MNKKGGGGDKFGEQIPLIVTMAATHDLTEQF